MEDAELAAIRARRMAELQAAKQGPSAQGGMGPRVPGGNGSEEGAEAQSKAEERRQGMLRSLLENDARERLARISIVRARHARSVEDMLLGMAQTGQLRQKVSEAQLIELLSSISDTKQESKIVFSRRPTNIDDADSTDDLGL